MLENSHGASSLYSFQLATIRVSNTLIILNYFRNLSSKIKSLHDFMRRDVVAFTAIYFLHGSTSFHLSA